MSRLLDELSNRGFVKQMVGMHELQSLMEQSPITLYSGFDPTASSLHVGHLLPLMLLAHFQRAGHHPIVVLGGGTGKVGDPTGRTEMRKLLDAPSLQHNLTSIQQQIHRILGSVQVYDNSEWLDNLSLLDFLRETGVHFSVNHMLKAETYKQRLETGLSFIEFNYQLLQAYDFLMLHQQHACLLQIGGDDQWSNMLAGVDLIRRVTKKGAYAITCPLLTNSTGQKMGKSGTGTIWLDANLCSPFELYQYWYGCSDTDVVRFLKLYTFLPLTEIAKWESVTGASLREAKAILAYEVTKFVHGDTIALDVHNAVSSGSLDVGIPTIVAVELNIVTALLSAGMASTSSEARRLITGGAVKVKGIKITDPKTILEVQDDMLIRVGRSGFIRVTSQGGNV